MCKKIEICRKKNYDVWDRRVEKKKLHAFDFNMKKLTTFEIDLNISWLIWNSYLKICQKITISKRDWKMKKHVKKPLKNN